jgi:RNA polymerase sigma-70 factor (ECF subfamily)
MSKREGDLADLVARRGPALVGYARALCGNTQQAEDLVQDALVKVYARWLAPARSTQQGAVTVIPLDPADADGAVVATGNIPTEAYVRRAIMTLFLDEHRRSTRWSRVKRLTGTPPVAAPPDTDLGIDIARAFQRLSPRQRACALLRFYDDLTVPQIAAQLGIAPGTVTTYLAEATHTLRGALGPSER